MRTSIPFADVAQFIEGLGADPANVHSVGIAPSVMTVTEFRRDKEGHPIAADDGFETVTTAIRIERGA